MASGSDQRPERTSPEQVPAGSVVSVLLEQHARIRALFKETAAAHGAAREAAFDDLRELLAVHEAGEERVVRPVTEGAADGEVAEARNAEERDAAADLAVIEGLDVDDPQFDELLGPLERRVLMHAELEEQEEFPYLLTALDPQEQLRLGTRLTEAQEKAPTHPHPSTAGSPTAQAVIGPFIGLLDRARDAFGDGSD